MTTGYELTFFTQQDRRHGHKPLAEWLLQEARAMGIRGATLLTAAEGFGHGQRLHSARFFELGDQPVALLMAVTAEEAERFLQHLRDEKVNVFLVKSAIEFGMTGDGEA